MTAVHPGLVPAAPVTVMPEAVPADRRNPYEVFSSWVLAQHAVTWPEGGFPMCACGYPARRCAVIAKAREVLGHPVPWTNSDPLAPPFVAL